MTRDKAKQILEKPLAEHFGNKIPSGVHEEWLVAFEKLGMLKLDEPKSLEQKLADLTEYGHRTLTEWRARLDSAGLKIVEK